jgi:hypothetical protein
MNIKNHNQDCIHELRLQQFTAFHKAQFQFVPGGQRFYRAKWDRQDSSLKASLHLPFL